MVQPTCRMTSGNRAEKAKPPPRSYHDKIKP